MKGRRALGIGLLLMAALAAFGMVASTAEAAPDRLRVTSTVIAPEGQGTVAIIAEDLSEPGLIAWTIDVSYDLGLVHAIDCMAALGGVCSPAFEIDVVRTTGASAAGSTEDTVLATFMFECGTSEGTSPLRLEVDIWGSAIPEDPRPELDLQDGTITCVAPAPAATATPAPSLPSTGSGPSTSSAWQWAVAILSGTGASLVGIWALRGERVP